jgi:hypothetical protein
MQAKPPQLVYKDLVPTRDYLQEVALILSSLQRAYVPKDPRDWHYGLNVNLRGLITQPFMIKGQEVQASLDLVRRKVRLQGSSWPLSDYTPTEIFNAVQEWLGSHQASVNLPRPKFNTEPPPFDTHQANLYAASLWWMDEQFRWLSKTLTTGLTSPILLYPHHFDLSLVWFPYNDERQVAIGYSSGDETITEPYLYLTAYPEPNRFTKLALPKEACYQTTGFSGAILTYDKLQASADPVKLFRDYAAILTAAKQLFS